jgi:PAS domain S-box-containing protein
MLVPINECGMVNGPGDSDDGLTQLEAHFAEMVSVVRDYAIFLVSPTGQIRSWNEGAARIKGYSAAEIIGQHFSRFYTPEAVAARWPDEELQLAETHGRFEDEGWRVRNDGTRFWANVVITPVYENGVLRGFLKLTRDLTDRKRAEEELRRSEATSRLLVESVKEYAIVMLDAQGRVATWNRGAERIKQYTAAEIIGRHFSVFYSSEDVAAGKPEQRLKLARELGSIEDEGWRMRKDGSLFWANVVVTALFDSDGKLLGYAKITRDMTDKRKVEALEVADRQKNNFLAMLAHELRNPLAPISNGLQTLKLGGTDASVVEQTTAMMERQLVHLVRLVDDLLDVSRIVTGKMQFRKEPVELSTVSLPARPVIVDADAVRLAQVFSNLLNNAAKYTETPSQIWLQVERDPNEDQVLVRVRDKGIGIAPEMLPNIFNLFVQADSSLARSRGGLGIGLSVVQRLVELHGGTVTAYSAGLGHGSEFVVRLPTSNKFPAATRQTQRRPSPRRKILVVDDNADAALTISTLLRTWGHDVLSVFDGPSALESVRNFKPDIVLLDIGMPGMSGYDVARHLRDEAGLRETVIIAVTGYGRESDKERSFAAGFDYHLTKPPDPQVLESLLAAPEPRSQRAANN